MRTDIKSLMQVFSSLVRKMEEPEQVRVDYDALKATIPSPSITDDDVKYSEEYDVTPDQMRLERIHTFFDNVCHAVPQIRNPERADFEAPNRDKGADIVRLDPDTSQNIREILESFYSHKEWHDDADFKHVWDHCMPDELLQTRFSVHDDYYRTLTDSNPVRESYTPFTHMVAIRRGLNNQAPPLHDLEIA